MNYPIQDSVQDLDELTRHALHYQSVLHEYCELSSHPVLSDVDADRIAAILEQAQVDPLLSFLIDEADHLLAHAYDLIDETFVRQQQAKLKQSLEKIWFDQLFQDLSTQPQTISRKELQAFLKNKGFAEGSPPDDHDRPASKP